MQRELWLALIIGNTRLHWGFFQAENLVSTWHTPHFTAELANKIVAAGFYDAAWQSIPGIPPQTRLPPVFVRPSQLWIASVVPEQTAQWTGAASFAQVVDRSHIPLTGLYDTLGSDRAINLLGAGHTLGWPVLVIDSGTALTFTAGGEPIDSPQQNHQPGSQPAEPPTVYGGAILPGMRLQAQALSQHTAALSEAISLAQTIFTPSIHRPKQGSQEPTLPARWATDTSGAIASGLVYGAIASITSYLTDWWHHFPTGKAVITGGDGPIIHALLKQSLLKPVTHSKTPEIISRVQVDSYLMFWGMRTYRNELIRLE